MTLFFPFFNWIASDSLIFCEICVFVELKISRKICLDIGRPSLSIVSFLNVTSQFNQKKTN